VTSLADKNHFTEAGITVYEKLLLKDAVVSGLCMVPGSRSELEVALYVYGRTLCFSYFSGRMREMQFYEDFWPGYTPPVGCCRQQFFKSKKRLIEKGVLEIKRKRADSAEYRLNIPMLLGLYIDWLVKGSDDKMVGRRCAKLTEIQKKVLIFWEGRRWMKLDSAIKEGMRKSEMARKQKYDTAMAAENLSQANVETILRGLCAEQELGYFDGWTRKLKRQAKNWLKECESSDSDPKQELSGFVEHFREMQRSTLHKTWHDGKVTDLPIPSRVSFEFYYLNRREIRDWLAIPKNERPIVEEYPVIIEGEEDGEEGSEENN